MLKCQDVVEYWGCMVTAADLAMMDLVAAFDCGNLGSLFGQSYPELAEAHPLNEYCLLDPFVDPSQDVSVPCHLKRLVIALERYCRTFQDGRRDAPFAADPTLY